MKRIFLISLALMFSEGMFFVHATPAHAATKILPGTVIPVQLAKTLDAKKVKAGDKTNEFFKMPKVETKLF